jgi:CRISPR-associated endoribonuclease Cas6
MTNAPDLLSLVISLQLAGKVEPDRPLPSWWGRAAQALVLKVIGEADPDLAAKLHDGDGVRPMTVSNLLGRFTKRCPLESETYTLRITGLQADVSARLLEAAQPGGALGTGAVVELDWLKFNILGAASDPAQQPWAGTNSFTGLAGARLVEPQPRRSFTFQFASPTGFHSKERTQPLPLPELVFGSLLQRWNAFAPLAFPDEARRFAEECLAVSRFELRSRAVAMQEGSLRLGCVGQVTYTALNADRYWLNMLHALAAYALYSGVGVRTGTGLGQVRAVETEP